MGTVGAPQILVELNYEADRERIMESVKEFAPMRFGTLLDMKKVQFLSLSNIPNSGQIGFPREDAGPLSAKGAIPL